MEMSIYRMFMHLCLYICCMYQVISQFHKILFTYLSRLAVLYAKACPRNKIENGGHECVKAQMQLNKQKHAKAK